MSKRTEIYVSIDIEADGRVPGLHSMLSFAAAIYDHEKNLLGTFSANLETLEGATQHAETMKFWNESEANQRAYEITRQNMEKPDVATQRFVKWLKQFPGTPIFVGYPAAFDFKWIDYYTHRFAGDNPFGFSRCIDVKTYAWALMGSKRFNATSKNRMPKNWFDPLPHTHVALDDAIEQGAMFINMLREARGEEPIGPLPSASIGQILPEGTTFVHTMVDGEKKVEVYVDGKLTGSQG